MHEFMYNTIRRIFNVATYGFLNMEVIGEENIPEKGPFIVACNHASNFDPPLLGTAMRHHLIHFMAKEELFRNPVMLVPALRPYLPGPPRPHRPQGGHGIL